MFTGIVEAIGTVRELNRQQAGARLAIEAEAIASSARLGDSLAVDGACLTVCGIAGTRVWCDLSNETIARTTLGSLRAGSRVNLERPLRLGDRVGGHLVTGHVDAVGKLVDRMPQGDGAVCRIRFPGALAPFIVPKGSIAVDGISLTVAALIRDEFDVAVIPYTLRMTTLGKKNVGALFNLEGDLIGKYVAHLDPERARAKRSDDRVLAALKEHGFA